MELRVAVAVPPAAVPDSQTCAYVPLAALVEREWKPTAPPYETSPAASQVAWMGSAPTSKDPAVAPVRDTDVEPSVPTAPARHDDAAADPVPHITEIRPLAVPGTLSDDSAALIFPTIRHAESPVASEVHPDGVAGGVLSPISVASIHPPTGTAVRDTVPVAEETTPPIAGVLATRADASIPSGIMRLPNRRPRQPWWLT